MNYAGLRYIEKDACYLQEIVKSVFNKHFHFLTSRPNGRIIYWNGKTIVLFQVCASQKDKCNPPGVTCGARWRGENWVGGWKTRQSMATPRCTRILHPDLVIVWLPLFTSTAPRNQAAAVSLQEFKSWSILHGVFIIQGDVTMTSGPIVSHENRLSTLRSPNEEDEEEEEEDEDSRRYDAHEHRPDN